MNISRSVTFAAILLSAGAANAAATQFVYDSANQPPSTGPNVPPCFGNFIHLLK